MSEQSATFGSADLTAQAETMLGQLESSSPSASPSDSESPSNDQATITESAPVQSTFGDDDLVPVKIDGKDEMVPFKELKNGYSRESVFTQRMQTLARQRQELEQYALAQQAQIVQQQRALEMAREEFQRNNPLQQLSRLIEQQQQKPAKNPNEIATLGELQQLQQELIQQVQQARMADRQQLAQELQQIEQQRQQEYEVRRDQAKFTDALQSVMDSDEGKLLADVSPQAEAIIRYQTMQMGPQDVNEAIQFMKQVTNEWASKVKGRVQTQTVTQQVAKARTVMEPPSGSPAPTIQQPKIQIIKKDGSVNYDGLRQKALSLLD